MLSPPFVNFVKYLFVLNAAWHGAASYYFMRRPKGILRKYINSQTPAASPATDLLQFLGGINTGYALLALLALKRLIQEKKVHSSDLWVLSLANFSQFFFDLVAHFNGTAKKSLLQITIPDGTFALIDAIAAYVVSKYAK